MEPIDIRERHRASRVNQEQVEYLRDALAKAERGAIYNLTILYVDDEGTACGGSWGENQLERIGQLELAKYQILLKAVGD